MPRGRVVAGIDIGTDKICTVIAGQAEETGKLHVIGVASQPSNGIRKSQIVDLEDTIAAITESVEAAERMAGYTLNEAFVSISGPHVKSQNSKGVVAVAEPQGEIEQADIERVIEAARALSLPSAEEIIHVIPRDYMVDSQGGIKDPLGMTGVRLEAEVHVITAATTAVRNIVKCVEEVGVKVGGLVFSGLASAMAVLSETEKELGVVLVDIGAGTTCLSLYIEGSLAYSGVLPVGARNITNDLAIGMRISLDSAEKIKLELSKPTKLVVPEAGSNKDAIKKKREDDKVDLTKLGLKEEIQAASRKTLVDGIIRPRLNEIFSLVGTEIKQAGLAGLTPAGVVITGGGAATVGAVEACRRTLSLPARVGHPQGLGGLAEEIQLSPYATVTGLVLYGAAHAPTSRERVNLSGGIGKWVGKIPIKGAVGRMVALLKSLLP
ncbi:cell division protein FtsA [Microgenomates group bacterium RIFCSPHIGHO2_01_FULL_45_11]|nr:MAG: cell division protein FtsA [Microgenomates group bacterium RIFCSPHIGHO2_01_FULL_45_11]